MSAQPPYGKSLLKCCFFSDENNGTGLKKEWAWPFREAKVGTSHRLNVQSTYVLLKNEFNEFSIA